MEVPETSSLLIQVYSERSVAVTTRPSSDKVVASAHKLPIPALLPQVSQAVGDMATVRIGMYSRAYFNVKTGSIRKHHFGINYRKQKMKPKQNGYELFSTGLVKSIESSISQPLSQI